MHSVVLHPLPVRGQLVLAVVLFKFACSVSCRTGPGHIGERVPQGEQRSAGKAVLARGMQVTAAQLNVRLAAAMGKY